MAEAPALSLADLKAHDPTARWDAREVDCCCPLPACSGKTGKEHRSLGVNTETGKWIVYDIDRLNALTEAFVAGKFYVEMKTQIAPDADGRQGVLIYCPESDIEATAEAIRATGVTGTMFWKPDTATVRRIHGIDGIKYLAPGSDGIVRNPYYHHEASA